ncbi:unnamed protein product [Heterobilharzia americana]|nr:unnamed protein product [Heterobilharzia americana]
MKRAASVTLASVLNSRVNTKSTVILMVADQSDSQLKNLQSHTDNLLSNDTVLEQERITNGKQESTNKFEENNNVHMDDALQMNESEVNYSNSFSSLKKLRLNKQFKSLSIDEQTEENEIRQKQLNKLYHLIQSNPGRYGELSIDDINRQMSHFYL